MEFSGQVQLHWWMWKSGVAQSLHVRFPKWWALFGGALKVMNDKTSVMQGSIRDPAQYSCFIEGYCLWNPVSVFTSDTVT